MKKNLETQTLNQTKEIIKKKVIIKHLARRYCSRISIKEKTIGGIELIEKVNN